MEWPHLIDNSLKAHHLYKRDVNYVVKDDEVIIVDEFTGRLMPGRQWSDGLHQAVEAKEGVRVKEETQTLATITLQNFFKLYNKICGMTGTAMTEADEFWKIYKLDVIAIPTNQPMQRINYPDVIYRTEREKFNADRRRDRAAAQVGRRRTEGRHRAESARSSKSRTTSIEFESKENARTRDDSARAKSSHRNAAAGRSWSAPCRSKRANGCSAMLEPARHQARGAQRQASQARGRDRRPGRPQGRRDHRHEHGRPRHRHHPGRQSRDDGLGPAARQIRHAPRRAAGRMEHAGPRNRSSARR